MGTRIGLLAASVMAALAAFALAAPAVSAKPAYDLVIVGGRIMDPETGADRVANIGISDGRIAAISKSPLSGKRRIDAKGLVVAPGFIDLHSHAQYPFGYDQQVRDGVTTALELEAGTYPVKAFYDSRMGKTRINFGASVGIQGIRTNIKTGIRDHTGMSEPAVIVRKAEWAETPFTKAERDRERAMYREEFAAGGLGMGVLYEYLPALGRDELYELMQDAAAVHAPVFVHVRASTHADVDNLMAPMQEMVADVGPRLPYRLQEPHGYRPGARHVRPRAQARRGHLHRGLPLRRRIDGDRQRAFQRGLARPPGRGFQGHRVAADGRADDRRELRQVPQ